MRVLVQLHTCLEVLEKLWCCWVILLRWWQTCAVYGILFGRKVLSWSCRVISQVYIATYWLLNWLTVYRCAGADMVLFEYVGQLTVGLALESRGARDSIMVQWQNEQLHQIRARHLHFHWIRAAEERGLHWRETCLTCEWPNVSGVCRSTFMPSEPWTASWSFA